MSVTVPSAELSLELSAIANERQRLGSWHEALPTSGIQAAFDAIG